MHGYAAIILYDIIGGIAFAFAHSTFIIQFILSYLHHRAFYKMFQKFVQKIDQPDDNGNRKNCIRKSIQFHVLAKKYVIIIEHVEIP